MISKNVNIGLVPSIWLNDVTVNMASSAYIGGLLALRGKNAPNIDIPGEEFFIENYALYLDDYSMDDEMLIENAGKAILYNADPSGGYPDIVAKLMHSSEYWETLIREDPDKGSCKFWEICSKFMSIRLKHVEWQVMLKADMDPDKALEVWPRIHNNRYYPDMWYGRGGNGLSRAMHENAGANWWIPAPVARRFFRDVMLWCRVRSVTNLCDGWDSVWDTLAGVGLRPCDLEARSACPSYYALCRFMASMDLKTRIESYEIAE